MSYVIQLSQQDHCEIRQEQEVSCRKSKQSPTLKAIMTDCGDERRGPESRFKVSYHTVTANDLKNIALAAPLSFFTPKGFRQLIIFDWKVGQFSNHVPKGNFEVNFTLTHLKAFEILKRPTQGHIDNFCHQGLFCFSKQKAEVVINQQKSVQFFKILLIILVIQLIPD